MWHEKYIKNNNKIISFQLTLGSSFVLNDLDETHLFVTPEIIGPLQVSSNILEYALEWRFKL